MAAPLSEHIEHHRRGIDRQIGDITGVVGIVLGGNGSDVEHGEGRPVYLPRIRDIDLDPEPSAPDRAGWYGGTSVLSTRRTPERDESHPLICRCWACKVHFPCRLRRNASSALFLPSKAVGDGR